jgi:hypothetical protein
MDPTIVVALLGAVATVAAVLITGWFGRRQAAAQTAQITATAHTEIYKSYETLITALRTDVQLARQEARGAHEAARSAEQRADQAEDKAYTADYRVRTMHQLLVDLRPLIAAHVPGADMWLSQVDRVVAAAARPAA